MRGAEDSTLLKFKSRLSSLGRVFYYNLTMELFVVCMAITGLATTIAAIDESFDWMNHYRREGEDDHRARQTISYDQFTEQGYRE